MKAYKQRNEKRWKPKAAGQVLLFIQTGKLNEIINNELPQSRKLASQCLNEKRQNLDADSKHGKRDDKPIFKETVNKCKIAVLTSLLVRMLEW